MTGRLRAPLAAGLGAACLLAAVASTAQGQYVVDHCRHFEPDSPFVAFPLVTGADVIDCDGGTGGLNARAVAGQMAAGSSLEIGLSIPADRPGIRIERVQSLYAADGPLSGAATLGFRQNDQLLATNAAPVTRPVDASLPPGARSLRWTLTCDVACQFQDEFPLFVNKNRLYLNESIAPTLTLTGGTLTGPGAKTGQQTVVFDAHDTDSGVSSVTVTLGSAPVAAVPFTCAFADWSACPRDQSAKELQVDTTRVPDGNHALVVAARDAAGNALTRSLGTVSIANAPGAGDTPNGVTASRAAKLAARFTTTTSRSRRRGFGTQPAIRGTLVGEQGQPIGGATVAVLQRLRQAGADPVQIATVTTGADGSFSHRLAGGPSRTITFAYRAFAGDEQPAATSVLRTIVRASVSAQISPRSVRAGNRITLSGRLRLLGRAGVEVRIQAREGSTWRTVDNVRTTRGGSFRWRYRFRPSQARRTFTFRARVTSPIYPFAAGNSRPVSVRVR